MSGTVKNKKSADMDFWSRRSFGNFCMGVGRIAKWITKRKERQRNREMIYKAMKNPENFEGRYPGE